MPRGPGDGAGGGQRRDRPPCLVPSRDGLRRPRGRVEGHAAADPGRSARRPRGARLGPGRPRPRNAARVRRRRRRARRDAGEDAGRVRARRRDGSRGGARGRAGAGARTGRVAAGGGAGGRADRDRGASTGRIGRGRRGRGPRRVRHGRCRQRPRAGRRRPRGGRGVPAARGGRCRRRGPAIPLDPEGHGSRVRAALAGRRFDDLASALADEWEARCRVPGWATPERARIASLLRPAGAGLRACGGGRGSVVAVVAPPGERGPGRREAVVGAAKAASLRLFPARVDVLGLDVEKTG